MYLNFTNRQETIKIIPALVAVAIFVITSFEKSLESFQKGNYILASIWIIGVLIVVIGIFLYFKPKRPKEKLSYSELEPIEKEELLHGRDDEKKKILTALYESENSSLIILSGPSGCGKSSLIKAGVIPNLDNNFVWALLTQHDNFRKEIINDIKNRYHNIGNLNSKTPLHLFLNNLTKRINKILVLIFDQFEQLYMEGSTSEIRDDVINTIKEVLAHQNKKVKVIVSVRDEVFKETVISFNGDNKPSCFYCQKMKIIDIGLLSSEKAELVLKKDLELKNFACEADFCKYVVRDLQGIWREGVLPVTLRIVSTMIAREYIGTIDHYKKQGGARGLQQRYLSLILQSVENREVVPLIIFSLCEPSRGSVTLTLPILAEIAQKPPQTIKKALDELNKKRLIYIPTHGYFRLVHEYLGKLLQERGTRVISPIEREELYMRREVYFSKGIEELNRLRVIRAAPYGGFVKWANSTFIACIIILVLRYIGLVPLSTNWFDFNFIPILVVGMGGVVFAHHYFLHLLSRLKEIERVDGRLGSYIMSIISFLAIIVIIWQPKWWPFVLAVGTLCGAIKDWQLASIAKESPELLNTFRSWRNSMFLIGLALIILGLALDIIKKSSSALLVQWLPFAIELGFAMTFGVYLYINALRFYSLRGLRPLISLFNLEVVGSLEDKPSRAIPN